MSSIVVSLSGKITHGYIRNAVAIYKYQSTIACTDIQRVYDIFLTEVHKLIDECVPVK